MKSRIKKLKGTAREIDIGLPKERVKEAIDAVLGEIQKNAKMPGFRPGKAPMDMISRRHHGDAVERARERLIPLAYQEALERHELDPVSFPEISDVNIDGGGGLSFKARVDCHPRIELKQYKGLKVTGRKVAVTDTEADEAIERLRNLYAEFIDTDRPLEKGDFAICDVESFIDGRPISKKRENMWIEVSGEASLLGIGEDLAGLRIQDEKEIEVTLPEGYPDKKYAGKKAVFKVKINHTREKRLPPLDDDMAKKAGKDTVGDLREEIRGQLMAKKEDDERVSMKNQILEQLIRNSRFELPGTMVERQFKVLMDRVEKDMPEEGGGGHGIDSRKDDMREQILREAEDKVRAYFILDEISKRENVDVAEDEIDSRISSLADAYRKPFEEVKKYYRERGLMGGLREQIREDKVLDLLLSEADISAK